jgi:hypothetical protein
MHKHERALRDCFVQRERKLEQNNFIEADS